MAEFAVNNKVYSAIMVFLFITNYGRELKIGTNIRRKEKVKKTIEFVKKRKKKARAVKKSLGRDKYHN